MTKSFGLTALLASTSLLAACATTASQLAVAPPPADAPIAIAAPAEPAPVAALASQIAIPHQSFTLANGLKVIVHEDHKAPIVAVSTWYNVGSKDEPKGKTGFAHLFEHLMFNGSDNLPGDYFTYLQQIGATDYNGTTWYDRTNYYQTVPKAAIERALFMESDRMGYLLGAVTQEKLDNQRGVVQNEKRQGDNQPGGLMEYEQAEALFPVSHPYRHSTIGSMADLDAASLADVKKWFIDKYGPNNAVLVLAGDISVDEARPLVQKHFGAIKRGPVNTPAAADVPTLAAPRTIVMKDRVAAVQIEKSWAVPGIQSDEMVALDLGASVLGGLASSRLDEKLVRDEKIAVSVSSSLLPFHRLGILSVSATVKPGVDPALVDRRLEEMLAEFIANGPTPEELQRAATTEMAGRIRGLEQVGGGGGKAAALAEGEVFTGNSELYKKMLAQYGAATPDSVRASFAKWVGRPALTIRLEPGDRPPYEEAKFAAKKGSARDIATPKVKRDIPGIGAPVALDFPDVSHITLANGVQVDYAQRGAVPVTTMALSFDAGTAADLPGERGLQSLTLGLLDEGAGGLTGQQIAEEQERLGARIGSGATADRSTVTLSALSANLAPSLDLLAKVVRAPSFDASEVDRLKTQALTGIAQAKKDPNSIASRALPPILFGANHPYASSTLGDEAAVKAVTRDAVVAFRDRWLRPDKLRIFVVSDRPLAEIQPLLDARFGDWTPPAVAAGVKQFPATPARASKPRIVLIDRPGSPQSVIYGGQVTPVDPRSDITALVNANDVLGGNFLSRINMDLRETKGWSYGVGGRPQLNEKLVPYILRAPVQADRTGDSIKALDDQIRGFLGTKGISKDEFDRTITNAIGELPGQFETSAAVLAAMQQNAIYGRPDNYYELLADKYRASDQASLDAAIRGAVDPNGWVWVVVGDAAKIRGQLDKLGYPIEVAQAR